MPGNSMKPAMPIFWCNQGVDGADGPDCERQAALNTEDGGAFCLECLRCSPVSHNETSHASDTARTQLAATWAERAQEAARSAKMTPSESNLRRLLRCAENAFVFGTPPGAAERMGLQLDKLDAWIEKGGRAA